MNQQNYECTIVVGVSTGEAIKSINSVCQWWATNVKGRSEDLNDFFIVRFGRTNATLKIIEVIPGKRIVWEVIKCYLPLFADKEQWDGTKLVWDISSWNNATQITFTHIGLVPGLECYNDCAKGWEFYIGRSLYKLLTQGTGLPGTGIFTYVFCDEREYNGLLFFKNDPLPDYPEGHLFIDVKETNGEQIISAYKADEFRKEEFNAQSIKGDYFMIIENKPRYGDIIPLEDILKTIN